MAQCAVQFSSLERVNLDKFPWHQYNSVQARCAVQFKSEQLERVNLDKFPWLRSTKSKSEQLERVNRMAQCAVRAVQFSSSNPNSLNELGQVHKFPWHSAQYNAQYNSVQFKSEQLERVNLDKFPWHQLGQVPISQCAVQFSSTWTSSHGTVRSTIELNSEQLDRDKFPWHNAQYN